jgi:drug/metabolite transporter (DMT)-like permease
MRPAALAGLITLALIWGTAFLLVELALQGTGPTGLVLGRMALAGALLLLLARIRRVALPGHRQTWLLLAGMSLIGQALPLVLFAAGQQRVTSALAGVYSGATPLLTIPIVWLILRVRPSAGEVLASVVGFAGLAVVLSPWDTAGGSYLGQLFCLAGALCFGLAYAYATKLLILVNGDKLSLAAAQAVSGTAILLPVAFVTEGPGRGPALHLTGVVVAAIVGLGLGSAAAFVINYWLIDRVGPVQASLAFYLIPVVAVMTGFAVRGERLTPNETVGSVIVVAALGLLYAFHRTRRADDDGPDSRPSRASSGATSRPRTYLSAQTSPRGGTT